MNFEFLCNYTRDRQRVCARNIKSKPSHHFPIILILNPNFLCGFKVTYSFATRSFFFFLYSHLFFCARSTMAENETTPDNAAPTKAVKVPTSSTAISTLFVGKIPPTATSKDLEEFFGEIGPIRNCFVVADKSKGKLNDDSTFRNKGVGYVHFAVPDDAKEALEKLKTVKFKGKRPLTMEFAQRKSISGKRSAPSDQGEEQQKEQETKRPRINKTGINKAARLIVRNLPWKYNEKDLEGIFGKYGPVTEVRLPRKFPGGPLRGFAFVQFKNVKNAEVVSYILCLLSFFLKQKEGQYKMIFC